MKRTLLILNLFCAAILSAQIPSGAIANYRFSGGSFVNLADPGNGDLVPQGNGWALRQDRDGNPAAALRNRQEEFDGIRLASATNTISFSFWYFFESPVINSQVEGVMQMFDPQGKGVRITKVSDTEFDVRVVTSDADQTIRFSDPALGQSSWAHVVVNVARRSSNYAVNMIVNGSIASAQGSNVVNSTGSLLNSNAPFILSPVVSQNGLRSATDDIRIYTRELAVGDAINLSNEPGTSRNPIVLRVDPSATGNNSGDSWSNAMTSLQAAIDATLDGDEIWIKEGKYKPGTPGNRNFRFRISTGISLYGGFQGNETSLSDRSNPFDNPTIIDGDLAGNDDNRVIDSNSTYNDNSTTLMQVSASNVVIDGFTFTSAYASNSSSVLEGIGSLFIDNVKDVTISNSLFERNVARIGGAGIYYEPENQGNTTLTIDRCIFRNNLSPSGTGVFVFASDNTNLDLDISNSLFYDNRTETMTGGRPLRGGSSIYANAFRENSNIDAFLTNNAFIDNDDLGSTRFTVVIGHANSFSTASSNGTIENNLFFNNINFSGSERDIHDDNSSRASFILRNNISSYFFDQLSNIQIGLNNRTGTPSFVDRANDDFRPASGSLQVDNGNNAARIGSLDLNQNDRIAGGTVDIGPYEFGSTASLDSSTTLPVRVYPNPVSAILNIDCGQHAFAKASLFNLQGQELITATKTNIDLSGMSTGTYILRIEDQSGNQSVHKIVKR